MKMTKEFAINLLNDKNVYLTKKGKRVLKNLIGDKESQSKEPYEGEVLCTDQR
ncbi:hypothetical protein ABEY96_28200 [Priestia aryabhattai]|uniref:hypothetical protein n=1 Tax=Priestia aryabhattai TaxID=412384 RepID=UPI003D2C69CD